MRIIHGLITLLAAVVVIVFGGSWLMLRYNIGPDFGLLSLGAPAPTGVPARGSSKLTIDLEYLRPGFRMFDDFEDLLIPVRVGSPQRSFIGGYNRRARDADNGWHLSSGGSCWTPTVNLLQVDSEKQTSDPVFDRRVFLPEYAVFTDANVRQVMAMVVDKDTNGDGRYSCLDAATLRFIWLGGERAPIVLEREFVPEDISDVDFDGRARTVTFVWRSPLKDDLLQKELTVSFDGEIISEVELPNFLSKAKLAFDKTD